MKDDRELARHGDRDAMTVAILMFCDPSAPDWKATRQGEV